MKLASVLVKIGKGTVWITATPAEVAVLTAIHKARANGHPIVEVKPLEETVERDDVDEIARLRNRYTTKTVTKVFGPGVPNLPEDFETAMKYGMLAILNEGDAASPFAPPPETKTLGDE